MMVTNLKSQVTLDANDYDADFRHIYREFIIAQFEQELYNKSFSHHDPDRDDAGLQKKRNKF